LLVETYKCDLIKLTKQLFSGDLSSLPTEVLLSLFLKLFLKIRWSSNDQN